MKKTILILATTLVGFGGISQDYFHKLGVGLSFLQQEYTYLNDGQEQSESEFIGAPNIVYQGGLDFEFGNNMLLSPTVYPSLGFGLQASTYGSTYYLAFELPVVAELHFGDDREEFGGFVGLGFSYSFYSVGDSYSGSGSASALGPQISGGIHFNTDDISFLEALIGSGGITLRAAYTIPVNKPKVVEGFSFISNKYTRNVTLSLLYDLGR